MVWIHVYKDVRFLDFLWVFMDHIFFLCLCRGNLADLFCVASGHSRTPGFGAGSKLLSAGGPRMSPPGGWKGWSFDRKPKLQPPQRLCNTNQDVAVDNTLNRRSFGRRTGDFKQKSNTIYCRFFCPEILLAKCLLVTWPFFRDQQT